MAEQKEVLVLPVVPGRIRFGRNMEQAVWLIEQFVMQNQRRINPVILAGVPYLMNKKVLVRLLNIVGDAELSDKEVVAVVKDVWADGFDPTGDYSEIAVRVAKGGIDPDSLPMTQMTLPVGVDSFVPELCSGAVFFIGNTGAGKTTYIVDQFKPDVLIRWGEPAEHVDLAANIIHTRTYGDTILLGLFFACLGARVAIDSIRAVAYGMRSQAGAKGIAARLPLEATSISLAFTRAQNVAVVALNPLLEEDATGFLVSQLASSSAGAVHLRDGGTVVSETYRTIKGRLMNQKNASSVREKLAEAIDSFTFNHASPQPELQVAPNDASSLQEQAWRGAGRPADAAPGATDLWDPTENEQRIGSRFIISLNTDDEI